MNRNKDNEVYWEKGRLKVHFFDKDNIIKFDVIDVINYVKENNSDLLTYSKRKIC